MKLKVTFGEETRFVVPCRRISRTGKQYSFGTPKSIRRRAMSEQPESGKRPDD
jgi:hypothetical protein